MTSKFCTFSFSRYIAKCNFVEFPNDESDESNVPETIAGRRDNCVEFRGSHYSVEKLVTFYLGQSRTK